MSIKQVEDLSLQELYVKKSEIEDELDMLFLIHDKILAEIKKE